MTHTRPIVALALAIALSGSGASGAMARGGGHNVSPQHANVPTTTNGGGRSVTVAAKSVNVGGLSKFVLKNAIKGGKLVAGSLGSLGSAMSAPGRNSGGSAADRRCDLDRARRYVPGAPCLKHSGARLRGCRRIWVRDVDVPTHGFDNSSAQLAGQGLRPDPDQSGPGRNFVSTGRVFLGRPTAIIDAAFLLDPTQIGGCQAVIFRRVLCVRPQGRVPRWRHAPDRTDRHSGHPARDIVSRAPRPRL